MIKYLAFSFALILGCLGVSEILQGVLAGGIYLAGFVVITFWLLFLQLLDGGV